MLFSGPHHAILLEEHFSMSAVQVQANPERRSTVSEIAHELGCHPIAPVRWIQKGALVSTGERVKLAGIATPGGWRVRRHDLDTFLEVLTDDRLRPKETPAPKAPAKSARVAAMQAGLSRAGF
jgi:hypothetical protein